MHTHHYDDVGAGEAFEPADYSWMDQYSTEVLDNDDFGLGVVFGFGACFTLACLGVGVVGGFAGWFG